MSRETYQGWQPVPDLPRNLHWQGFSDTLDGLCVLLRDGDDSSRLLSVFFARHEAYRACDEGNRLKTLHAMGEQPPGSHSCGFFIVENSSFLEWYHDESLDRWIDRPIKHYLILTNGDMIDVLSEVEPTVTWEARS